MHEYWDLAQQPEQCTWVFIYYSLALCYEYSWVPDLTLIQPRHLGSEYEYWWLKQFVMMYIYWRQYLPISLGCFMHSVYMCTIFILMSFFMLTSTNGSGTVDITAGRQLPYWKYAQQNYIGCWSVFTWRTFLLNVILLILVDRTLISQQFVYHYVSLLSHINAEEVNCFCYHWPTVQRVYRRL